MHVDRWLVVNHCLVVTVWEGGARLNVKSPEHLTEFLLYFTWSHNPVSRQCKRVWTRGDEIEVECKREQPSYLMHMRYDR